MAKNITVHVSGGEPKAGREATTVGELAKQMGCDGYTATINGEPANSSDTLKDFEYVAFAKPVKAG